VASTGIPSSEEVEEGYWRISEKTTLTVTRMLIGRQTGGRLLYNNMYTGQYSWDNIRANLRALPVIQTKPEGVFTDDLLHIKPSLLL
jgi:hypothetical protein